MMRIEAVRQRMASPKRMRGMAWAAAAGVLLLGVAVGPYSALRHPLSFDDAFVYMRYAGHVRDGLGLSWNPDGVPTYGPASPLWVLILVPFSTLPQGDGLTLQLASWSIGVSALVVMAFSVATRCATSILKLPPAAFTVCALPLLLAGRFSYHLTTGMDTMLSLLANTLVVAAALKYLARPSPWRAALMGFAAGFAIAARPENMVCAFGGPIIACLTARDERRLAELTSFLLVFTVLAAGDFFLTARYFGLSFPLSHFVESRNVYAGFTTAENALDYGLSAAVCLLPFLGMLGAHARRLPDRLGLVLLVPAAATCLYLLTVRQHMGFQGRFYVPFFPWVIVPSMLALDRALGADVWRAMWRAGAGIAAAFLAFALSQPVQRAAEAEFLALTVPRAAVVPMLVTQAAQGSPPRTDWVATLRTFGDSVARLPRGVVVAAPEVGYLGFASPDKRLIDLTGLNDLDIALQGFSMDGLLERAPDLIWFPPPDYTGLRAAIFSDARLFEQYRVVAGAFNYGIAVRRDSPYRELVDAAMRTAWKATYPSLDIEHYVASGAVTAAP